MNAGLGAGGVGSFLFVFGEVEIGHVVLVVFGVSLASLSGALMFFKGQCFHAHWMCEFE